MSKPTRTGYIREINGPIVTIVLPGVRNGEQVRICLLYTSRCV